MLLYLSIFTIILLLYLNTKDNPQSTKILKCVMVFFALFVGLSDMLGGYDRYIYAELFDTMAQHIRNGGNVFDSALFTNYRTEWAYCALNYLISFVSVNRYIFILIVTCIIYFALYHAFKRYTSNYMFAVLLFLGLWFFFSFTYLRQVLAAVIGWFAIKYVIERKPWHFFAIVVLAYGFHNSAIMLAPLYFIPVKQIDKNVVMFIMLICFFVGLTNIAGSLFETYTSLSGQEERLARIGEAQGDGRSSSVNINYVLEALFFLWCILMSYHKIDLNDKRAVLLRNMALIFCAILLIFTRSSNGGRLAWFYMIGVISTLTTLYADNRQMKFRTVLLVVISLILYVRIYTAWQHYDNLYPYKTFLTDGYRDPDYSHEKYEYDHNYDIDKFYK